MLLLKVLAVVLTVVAPTMAQVVTCGSSINSASGSVQSPNYPNNYPNNFNCVTVVTAPAGSRITITFQDFQVEWGWDFVKMYDGTSQSAPLIASLNGVNGVTNSYNTTGSSLFVAFTSDSSINFRGFKLNFSAASSNTNPQVTICGSNVVGTSGIVTSPNYPSNYNNMVSCMTLVTSPPGTRITVTMIDFQMEQGWDFMKLFDGTSSNGNLMASLTGQMPVTTTYTTTGNNLFISFTTDASVVFQGFKLAFTSSQAYGGGCSKGVLTTSKVQEIKEALRTNIINPFGNGTVQLAQAIRLAFHDCTGGCDGCLNVNDTNNLGRFITTFNNLNAFYTAMGYGSVLSRADFYALAAIVGIEQGIQIANVGCNYNCIPMHSIEFKYCRQDCSTSPNTNALNGLPDGKINHADTLNFFSSAFGLNDRLATALLGVHTVGFCGGNASSGFVGSWKGLTDDNGVKLNTKFNNGYFQNLIRTDLTWTQMNTQDPTSKLGPKFQWFGRLANGTQASFMLNTDMSLLKDIQIDSNGSSSCTFGTCNPSSTAYYVNQFANDASAWICDFSTAFSKMINTGNPTLYSPQNSDYSG